MEELNIKFKKLYPHAKVPTKAHFDDAGWDLYALTSGAIEAGRLNHISTGIAIQIPTGYVGIIHGKSGLAYKEGIYILGGVIDSSYRGEIIVIASDSVFDIVGGMYSGDYQYVEGQYIYERGEKIAQLVLYQTPLHVNWQEVNELDSSERGTKGFGSTGK